MAEEFGTIQIMETKMIKPLKTAVVLALAALVSACAGSAEKPLLSVEESTVIEGYSLIGPVNSIRNFRINGWSHVDDKFIIVSAGVRDHYLIGFRNSCRETGSAMNIAFTNTAGSITKADKVIVKAPGGFTDTCFIRTITKLEKVKKTTEKK